MVWVKVDENAPHHPKMRKVGPEAAWLWLSGIAHCNRFVTDGFIAEHDLGVLYPFPGWTPAKLRTLAAALVREVLWHPVEGGWRVHDYAAFQDRAMRAAVEERREYERTRKAGQRAGAKSKHGETAPFGEMSRRDTMRDTPRDNERDTPRDTTGCPTLPTRPDPTRPDPSPSALFARTGAGAREGESAAGEQEQTAETPVVTCSTVEPTRPLAYAADELVADLERVSRLRFSMPTVHLAELNKVLRDLSAQGRPITRAAIERVGAHLAAKHTAPMARGRPWVPSTTSLRGTDGAWGRLVSLCDEAHGCARCAAPSGADVIPLRPEALRPLLDAFLAGAGGAVPGVPREGMAAADAEKLLAAAGATPERARRMGEIAAGPSARWTSLRRFTEARRAPTVQELNACAGEGFSALHAAAARAAAPPPTEPRRPVRVISDAEAMRAQPYTGPSREAVGVAMNTILARYPAGVRRPSFQECYQEALALAGKQS